MRFSTSIIPSTIPDLIDDHDRDPEALRSLWIAVDVDLLLQTGDLGFCSDFLRPQRHEQRGLVAAPSVAPDGIQSYGCGYGHEVVF